MSIIDKNDVKGLMCPLPLDPEEIILLAHGGGGRLMRQLIETAFAKSYGQDTLDFQHDSATLSLPSPGQIAFTTDSYVVNPLFFPGGDIGSLAVYGTVNDLAMSGAKPLYLSIGFILEEGLPLKTLQTICDSINNAAIKSGVKIVTGDTKVVDRGKGDGIFINTTGIGLIQFPFSEHGKVGPSSIADDDAILISGDLGRHGIAIMAMREGLEFESQIESDSAPVADLVQLLIHNGIEIHCLRDLTRGGLASALNELVLSNGGHRFIIDEELIPVREDVRGACEILGLDPLYVANEGRFVAFVPKKDLSKSLEILKTHPLGAGAAYIGEVKASQRPQVIARSHLGTDRIIDLLDGEQLPRIC